MAPDSLDAGRSVQAACDWRSAFQTFAEARVGGPIEVDDLERFADAAMWLGEFEVCATARAEAFTARLADGENRRADALAIDLCMDNDSGPDRGSGGAS